MAGFEKLDLIVNLDVTYKTIGNLSINTGRGDGIRDNLVIREAGSGSNPVISGSGVKGVVRSTIEAMLTQASESQSNLIKKERLKVCIPITCFEKGHLPPNRFHPDHCINDEHLFDIKKDEPLFDIIKTATNKQDLIQNLGLLIEKFRQKEISVFGDLSVDNVDKNNDLLLTDCLYKYEIRKQKERQEIYRKAKPCLVCQMFGNTQHKGRIIFHDAKLPKDSNISTISRTHVAIDRNTGIAKGGALMTIETVPSGAVFNGSIVLVNPDKWMVGAVYDVMSKLIPKIGIGAKTTNGYGELEICICPAFALRCRNDETDIAQYIENCKKAWHDMINLKYE